MFIKVGKNVVWVSSSLDPGESFLESHPDPSCLHMGV